MIIFLCNMSFLRSKPCFRRETTALRACYNIVGNVIRLNFVVAFHYVSPVMSVYVWGNIPVSQRAKGSTCAEKMFLGFNSIGAHLADAVIANSSIVSTKFHLKSMVTAPHFSKNLAYVSV